MPRRRELQRVVSAEADIALALRWADSMIRQALPGGEVAMFLGRPRRTLDQNAKFHAICHDVAKQATYMERKLRSDQWKVLFVSGHAIATGLGADVVPGLENEFVNIRESTAGMSKARLASLIEYVLAWCAENEIALREKRAS